MTTLCHLCGNDIGADDFLNDVHSDCFPDCRCLSCTELRQQMTEDDEVDAYLDRLRERADDAWTSAAEPGPWIDPARDSWGDHWAELRAEQRTYDNERLSAREEERRAG